MKDILNSINSCIVYFLVYLAYVVHSCALIGKSCGCHLACQNSYLSSLVLGGGWG